jgi:four helix bundle protein
MATIAQFEDIEVWKQARELVNRIYQVTRKSPFKDDWGLKDQIQRAAVSIMSNIAEGFERGSNKEFIQFLFISRASTAEVRSLLYAAFDQNYIEEPTFKDLLEKSLFISRQIRNFISYLQSSPVKKH